MRRGEQGEVADGGVRADEEVRQRRRLLSASPPVAHERLRRQERRLPRHLRSAVVARPSARGLAKSSSTTERPLAQREANRQRHRAQAGMLDEAMMYG